MRRAKPKELHRDVFLSRALSTLIHRERCKGRFLVTGMTDTIDSQPANHNKTAAPERAEIKEASEQLFAARFTSEVSVQLAAKEAKTSCLLEVSVT